MINLGDQVDIGIEMHVHFIPARVNPTQLSQLNAG